MSDLTKRNPKFRAWVETLPDEYWAKKDLSACRLGWDAAIKACLAAMDNIDWDSAIEEGDNLRMLRQAVELEIKGVGDES